MCAEIIPDNQMIAKKFDMLTVIAFVGNKPTRGKKRKDENGNVITEAPKGTNKTWLCRCDCGKEVEMADSKLKNPARKTVLSCGCTRKRREYLPDTDWDLLYRHVKYEILHYPEEVNIPSDIMLLLVGLKRGQKTADYRKKTLANYSDRVVLNTFISCMPKIQHALKNNSFKSDWHKMSYICSIVSNNLPIVYKAMSDAKRQQENARSIRASNPPMETSEQQFARYKKANSNKKRKKIDVSKLYDDSV